MGGTYIGTFGGPSSSVHGNWMDLFEFHLETHQGEASFSPDFQWHNPRPQIGQTVALLTVEAVREYFGYLGEAPIEFMEKRFIDLSNRIREAVRAHEVFLNKPNARIWFWQIVLQKSFCVVDRKISEPWARFSCKDVGGHMISRLTHQ
jgi:hypothetical protein